MYVYINVELDRLECSLAAQLHIVHAAQLCIVHAAHLV